jgi:hypothetical protein
LDENDLLSLRTFNQQNPHYENASHVRFFSRVEVQRRSELKLQLLQTTRIDRLKKRDLRSQQAKDRWRKRRRNYWLPTGFRMRLGTIVRQWMVLGETGWTGVESWEAGASDGLRKTFYEYVALGIWHRHIARSNL